MLSAGLERTFVLDIRLQKNGVMAVKISVAPFGVAAVLSRKWLVIQEIMKSILPHAALQRALFQELPLECKKGE